MRIQARRMGLKVRWQENFICSHQTESPLAATEFRQVPGVRSSSCAHKCLASCIFLRNYLEEKK